MRAVHVQGSEASCRQNVTYGGTYREVNVNGKTGERHPGQYLWLRAFSVDLSQIPPYDSGVESGMNTENSTHPPYLVSSNTRWSGARLVALGLIPLWHYFVRWKDTATQGAWHARAQLVQQYTQPSGLKGQQKRVSYEPKLYTIHQTDERLWFTLNEFSSGYLFLCLVHISWHLYVISFLEQIILT